MTAQNLHLYSDLKEHQHRPHSKRTAGGIEHANTKLGRITSQSLIDLIDDLSEVEGLIQDLSRPLTTDIKDEDQGIRSLNRALKNSFHNSMENNLDNIQSVYRQILDLVESAQQYKSKTDLKNITATIRKEIVSLKSALRIIYHQRGSLNCVQDWQSPAYGSSMPIEFNCFTQGIKANQLDYKRDGHLDAVRYEQAFINEYASHLGSNNLQAYLTNCGMAAFTTILHTLAHELNIGSVSLAIQPMYFENAHLVRQFFPELLLINPESSEHLLNYLNEKKPSVILCDAVSNRGEAFSHEINTILNWAINETNTKTALVIDTTCLPSVLLPAQLFGNLPEHLSVILIESLAKHHQFGLDMITGGIILAHADDSIQAALKKSRAYIGTNITDASVGSLPMPNKTMLKKRLERHSRNIQLFAEKLENKISQQNSLIESVSWIREPIAKSWYRTSCLRIRFHKPYRSIPYYRKFESKVVEIAKKRNHPLILGSSFGFDVTRLYLTTPATPFDEPAFRLSIGTETQAEIETFLEILFAADYELTQSLALKENSAI